MRNAGSLSYFTTQIQGSPNFKTTGFQEAWQEVGQVLQTPNTRLQGSLRDEQLQNCSWAPIADLPPHSNTTAHPTEATTPGPLSLFKNKPRASSRVWPAHSKSQQSRKFLALTDKWDSLPQHYNYKVFHKSQHLSNSFGFFLDLVRCGELTES